MKLLQTSDTHIGITTEGQLRVMFKAAAKEDFDVLIHCGDYCGTQLGWKAVKRTVEMIRKHMPDKPFISTIGNHDYWCLFQKRKKVKNAFGETTYKPVQPDCVDYLTNLENIRKVFRDNEVHFLDKDGVYIHPDFQHIKIIGASGWYTAAHPETTDYLRLPLFMEGDTHRSIRRATELDLFAHEETLTDFDSRIEKLVFVSHFPVIKADDRKGRFEDFSWSEALGDYFQSEYNCKHFLCGHAHMLHKGPLRYECGPDYCKPTYQIIEV